MNENFKALQLKIIEKYNPMLDDYHTGIRDVLDIHTLQEIIDLEDYEECDRFTPDYSINDIKKALNTGFITVYSSYPITQGVFVTPSKIEAKLYAGEDEKIYSDTIPINSVAWIDVFEGQYANIDLELKKEHSKPLKNKSKADIML